MKKEKVAKKREQPKLKYYNNNNKNMFIGVCMGIVSSKLIIFGKQCCMHLCKCKAAGGKREKETTKKTLLFVRK